jgi:predicted transcriptional regulator with HTH domain
MTNNKVAILNGVENRDNCLEAPLSELGRVLSEKNSDVKYYRLTLLSG